MAKPPQSLMLDDLVFFSPNIKGEHHSRPSTGLSRDFLHLKTLLQRERQIAEERLRALEQRDALLAAADSRRKTSHQDSARRREDLSLAERRLNEERNKRAELQCLADELTLVVEVYKKGHVDLSQKLIDLIEKESWRINEHPRELPEKSIPVHSLAPKEVLTLLGRLVEKLVLFTNTSSDRQRTELLERSRARQDSANQRIEELEAQHNAAVNEIQALKASRMELEGRLRQAESEKIQLRLEMDLAKSEVLNERSGRDQTIDMMRQSIEECRIEIADMQAESEMLKAHCASVEETEARHRDRVQSLQQQLETLNARVEFCQKNHARSSQGHSPLREVTGTPQLDSTSMPSFSQTTDILSTSAPPSARLEFPDPVIHSPVASQPVEPGPAKRGTRARRARDVDLASSDATEISSVAAKPKGAAKARNKPSRSAAKKQS